MDELAELFFAEENEFYEGGDADAFPLESDNVFEPRCPNCHGSSLVEDFARGDVVCVGCGCVVDVILCDAPRYDQEAAPRKFTRQAWTGARTCAPKSLPYKRLTYFTERLTQWQQREPPIPEEDEEAIGKCWETYAPLCWPDWDTVPPTKERIRAVLASLDEQCLEVHERPRFVRVYLEKWLTIRDYLHRYPSYGTKAPHQLINALKADFRRVEKVFERHIRRVVGRHSLMNYNFIMRRLLELHGYRRWIVDFLPLKTKPKQKKLVEMWRIICAQLQWPYVNHDCEMFPNYEFFNE